MVAHDIGTSITLNRGRTYRNIILPIAQMYHVYTDNLVPYHVYANRQDGYSYRGPSNTRGAGGITDIPTCAEIVERMMQECRETIQDLAKLI